jgi:hypothetical protein
MEPMLIIGATFTIAVASGMLWHNRVRTRVVMVPVRYPTYVSPLPVDHSRYAELSDEYRRYGQGSPKEIDQLRMMLMERGVKPEKTDGLFPYETLARLQLQLEAVQSAALANDTESDVNTEIAVNAGRTVRMLERITTHDDRLRLPSSRGDY